MTRDNFEVLLDRKPDDWELRLVYSDWLIENAESDNDVMLSEAQKWLAENKKHPHHSNNPWVDTSKKESYDWWPQEWNKNNVNDPLRVYYLPVEIFTLLPVQKAHTSKMLDNRELVNWYEFPTRREAERQLAIALAKYRRQQLEGRSA